MISCEGCHNKVKVLCFTQLNGRWLESRDLSAMLDSSPASLRTLLARWTRWSLVTEHIDGEGNRSYTLSHKGYSWLSKHWREFPLGRWVGELPPERQGYFSFLFQER